MPGAFSVEEPALSINEDWTELIQKYDIAAAKIVIEMRRTIATVDVMDFLIITNTFGLFKKVMN